MKLLGTQPSPRGESSDSIALTKSFIEVCKVRQCLDRRGYVERLA